MIENEYPIPSYMADIFQAPKDWIEIPLIEDEGFPEIYGIDCEMVGFYTESSHPLLTRSSSA